MEPWAQIYQQSQYPLSCYKYWIAELCFTKDPNVKENSQQKQPVMEKGSSFTNKHIAYISYVSTEFFVVKGSLYSCLGTIRRFYRRNVGLCFPQKHIWDSGPAYGVKSINKSYELIQ